MPIPVMAIPQAATQQTNRRTGGLPGNIRNLEEGFVRDVDPNELVSTHVEQLGASGNRGLRQSRMRGMQAGASRGGINSQLAAATGENAWLDAAQSMGEQQAAAYGQAAGQNLDSLARQRLGTEQNATSVFQQIHGDNTSAYMNQSRIDADRETDIRRRDWDVTDDERDYGRRQAERREDRDWAREDEDRNYQRGIEAGTIGVVINQAMNDPTLRNNPQAMWGFLENTTNEIRRLLGLPDRPAGAPGG